MFDLIKTPAKARPEVMIGAGRPWDSRLASFPKRSALAPEATFFSPFSPWATLQPLHGTSSLSLASKWQFLSPVLGLSLWLLINIS